MAGRPARAPTAITTAGDPVIERAFTLLSGFDPAHRVLSLSELARRSGLPTSSALRLARQLVSQGALERRDATTSSGSGSGNSPRWHRAVRDCGKRPCR